MSGQPAIDVFCTQLQGDAEGDEPVCAICHDALSSAQTYKLPECGHTFHTHCIVTWFRHARTEPSVAGAEGNHADAPCPYCMHRGVNNRSARPPFQGRYGRCFYAGSMRVLERERLLRRYAREHPNSVGAQEIASVVSKLRTARQHRAQARQSYTDLKKELKIAPSSYFDAQKRIRDARRRLWRCHTGYRTAARLVLDYPVVPLIIPVPLDLN